jgi:DNA-binding transcriptional ArsR family regulator
MESKPIIDALAALAQETRLQVFRELVKAHGLQPDEGGLAAGELATKLAIPAPTLSFHLKELYRAGLVRSRKQGRSIIYEANLGTMRQLLLYLLEDCCGGACDLPIEKSGANL